MIKVPSVISRTELSNTFLGDLVQVCIVTRDCRQTVDGMVKMGFGPWSVRTFDGSNTTQRTFRGKPSNYSMKLCAARSRNMGWEVIEPIEGPSIYTEFLDRHGEGVQHLAFNCVGLDYEEQQRRLSALGYEMVQSGVYREHARFHYYATEADLKTVIEIWSIPEGFDFGEPDAWIPGPPPPSSQEHT